MVHWYFDSGYCCIVVTIHVDLSRRFYIFAVSERGSAHECVVKLLAVFGWGVRGFVVVLLFVERVGQYQLVLDCPVPEPPMYSESIASGSSFDPTCPLKSPPINSACSSSSTCKCASGARSTLVARVRLRIW